ncbi:lytic transglycosylase domain-containing protein [Georgenia sp. SYP-B2076]|uniref:lytic transglycosylase domain-containing protein n=1 Tax=Georgenia sp. SYP-B2076 TaxID=2495881 RepID=UPI001F0CBBF6|nr:lytic transglycosylase domain-containing protein [Georgenia sp. SYP-B2076]
MSKADQRSRTVVRTHAGRAGVGLALAATTAVSVAVPAAQAQAAPGSPATSVHGRTGALAALATVPVPAAAPTMTYRVQAGDTVSHIAARTGSSVSAITQANGLGANALIRVGQMLKVPSPATAAASVSAPAASGVHTVAAGETLSGLAKAYGTTVAAIVTANGLPSADRIRVGQALTIGSGSARPLSNTVAPAAPAATAATHKVAPGDTVSALAKKYGTTVAAIAKANNLGPSAMIYVGQKLAVGGAGAAPAALTPVAPIAAPAAVTAEKYQVRAGDTVTGLAKSWGTTVAAVIKANKLDDSGLIYVGQSLKVPGDAGGVVTVPTTTPLVPNTFLGRTYPEATVAAANANKATLLANGVPSRSEMQSTVARVAKQMGVDPALAQAHAYQESGFNHASVSPANALGTMQVIPTSGEWASDLVGRKLNLLDPADNVVAGVAIIRQLVRTSPDLETAIASYYQGAGSVKRNGMFDDTKRYVASVKAHMTRF